MSSDGWDTAASHALAAGQLAAGLAGQQARPTGAVEHAQHPAVAAQQPHERRGQQAGVRVLPAHVDDVDDRASPPARRPATGVSSRPPVERLERRAGRRQHAGHARPAAPARRRRRGRARSATAPAGAPRRARRHDHGRRQVAHRRPGRGPGADDGGARPRPGPSPAGAAATGTPARRRPAATARASAAVGHSTSALPSLRRRRPPPTGRSTAPGGRRLAAGPGHRPRCGRASRTRPAGPAPTTADAFGRRVRAGGRSRHDPFRRRRAQERRGPARPAPGRPVGQLEQVGAGTPPRPLGQRAQASHRPAARRRAPDPPADPAPGESDAHTVADAHLAPERVGDQVVERLGDGRLVGQDADDLPAGQLVVDRCAVGRQRPSADFKSSTRVVCSQVSSLSLRPK